MADATRARDEQLRNRQERDRQQRASETPEKRRARLDRLKAFRQRRKAS